MIEFIDRFDLAPGARDWSSSALHVLATVLPARVAEFVWHFRCPPTARIRVSVARRCRRGFSLPEGGHWAQEFQVILASAAVPKTSPMAGPDMNAR